MPRATSTSPFVVEVRPERTNAFASDAGLQQKSTDVSNVPVKTVSSSGGVPVTVSRARLTSVPLSTWQEIACALLRALSVSTRWKSSKTHGWEMPSVAPAPSKTTVWPFGSRCIFPSPPLMP